MEYNNSDIIIRDFLPEDSPVVARIITEAFGSKIGKLFRTKRKKVEEMFYTTMNKNRKNGVVVAELDGSVIAYMKLCSREFEVERFPLKVIPLIKEFGFKDSLVFLVTLNFLEYHSLKDGECYLSQIAVSREGRGRGVGTLLLKAGEEKCRANGNISTYSLYVMKENSGAHKLYKKIGFEDIRSDSFPGIKRITGYSAAIFMEKKL